MTFFRHKEQSGEKNILCACMCVHASMHMQGVFRSRVRPHGISVGSRKRLPFLNTPDFHL